MTMPHPLGAEVARHLQGGPLLDLGCGDGTLLRSLGAQGSTSAGGSTAVGLDRDPEALAQARRWKVRVVQADAHAIPFRSASCASITMVWFLAHTHSPATVLCEVARVLRLGGRAVAVHDAPRFEHDDIHGIAGRLVERSHRNDTLELLERQSSQAGLRIASTGWTAPILIARSPVEVAHAVESGAWASLRGLSASAWTSNVAPVVRALRDLPRADQPRTRRVRYRITALEAAQGRAS